MLAKWGFTRKNTAAASLVKRSVIALNFLYVIAIIPTFIVLLYTSTFLMPILLGVQTEYDFLMGTLLALIITCLWGAGPVTSGFVYILRNFSREEHSWIFSDFFQQLLKNFKQSIVVFLVDLVFLFLFAVAFSFYAAQMQANMLFFPMYILLILLFVIYTSMHLYIYPMMVTFKLPLRELYKNSLIFAMARIPQNILIIASIIAIVVAAFLNLFGFILLVLALMILFSLCGFISVFWSYPTLQRHMLQSDDEVKSDYET